MIKRLKMFDENEIIILLEINNNNNNNKNLGILCVFFKWKFYNFSIKLKPRFTTECLK